MRKREKTRTIPGKKTTKRTLTLLELFLCLAILALIGGVVLIRALPMLDHYRFESDAKRFVRELNVSKHLATTAHSDIAFHLKREKKALVCMRTTDEPLKISRVFNTKIPFYSLFSVKINDREVENLKITFTGTGWIKEQGCLSIESKRGEVYRVTIPQFPQLTLTPEKK